MVDGMIMKGDNQMNFLDRMQKSIAKGYENVSGLLSDAAEKAKELGEKGLLEFEIKKLEKEVENILPLIGSEVYTLYHDDRLKVTGDLDEVKMLLKEVYDREMQIVEKEKKLEELKR